ncbi:hypothetical protein XENOCAPTIV_023712, partial [Xenoophorus captivus]
GVQIPEIEWEDSGLPLPEESNVTMPSSNLQLTDEQMVALRNAVNPKATSLSSGCDIYIAKFNFASSFLLCESCPVYETVLLSHGKKYERNAEKRSKMLIMLPQR